MSESRNQKWFVFYTRPRFEKKIQKTLNKLGYETYLPTYESIRQWKDRKKKVEMLYFPNYIFIYFNQHDIWKVISTPGIVGFVRKEGKPAVLSDNEIKVLMELKLQKSNVAELENFDKGQLVRICEGPLKDLTGEIIKIKNKLRLGVRIKAINKFVFVEISPSELETIPKGYLSTI